MGEVLSLVDFGEADCCLADVVVVIAIIIIPKTNVHSLVAIDVEREGVLPDWGFSHVVGRTGLLGVSGDGDLRIRIHSTEGLGIVGQISRLWLDDQSSSGEAHFIYNFSVPKI